MNVDDVACPLESVTSDSVVIPLEKVPLAPEAGAVNVTVAPLIGTPELNTPASNCVENGVPTFALCCDPSTETIVNTDVERFVTLNVAGADAPDTVADTEYAPAVELAVNVEEVAIPLESVVSVSVIDLFANVPLAFEDGAVNVTITPLIGVPFWVTTADSGIGNAVPTSTLCNDPLVAFTASTLDDEEDDDEFELAQPERATRAATQMLKPKILKALPTNCTFRSALQGIVETPAGFRTKPRSLMSLSLLGQILV